MGSKSERVRRAVEVASTDGVGVLASRLGHRASRRLLRDPRFPPIGLEIGGRAVGVGTRKKYIHNGAFALLPSGSDVVVEAGVYHGKDTALFATLADSVVGFEPSPRNYKTAKHNLRRFDNVELRNAGLWDSRDSLEIQYGAESHDDGFLDPDSGTDPTQKSATVPVMTVEEVADGFGFDRIDFLKVEAEGAQPEILDGIGDVDVGTIVVNGGGVRDGEAIGEIVLEQLHGMGYSLAAMKKGHIMFFTSEPVEFEAFPDVPS